MPAPPLIITLALEPAAQAFFDAQREKYFPAHANYLQAHITLFHHLPSDNVAIVDTLAEAAASTPAFTLQVTHLHNIGNGVAYVVESDALQQLHHRLQQVFDPWLIRQDRQPLWPHITIQNKVTAFKALQLQQQLAQDFVPHTVMATGLHSWHYLNGPWEHVRTLTFGK